MYRYHALKRGGPDEKLRSCPRKWRNYQHVLFILKQSKIIAVNRLVHYGQSQHYCRQY